MKNRIYTPAMALALLAAGAQAQQAGTDHRFTDRLQRLEQEQVPVQHPAPQAAGQRATLFSEDFNNGLAGNNGVGAWTVAGPNGNVWRYTHTGPNGAYSPTPASLIIASATAANGFVIFNSDSANTNWGVTPPAEVTNSVALTGSLVSPVLDLSATPAVEVRFTQRFRFCCATPSGGPGHFLEVSTDGGATWPTRYSVEDGLGNNTESGTRDMAINIAPAIAANPANVRFRFTQDGSNGISHYYWQVDDVQVNTLPDHELIMLYGYTAQFGGGVEYGTVPQSQMPSSINVGSAIYNYGGNAQTNVSLTVSLKNASNTEVGSLTIPVGTIASGDTAHPDGQLTVPANMPLGTYTADFTMTSDDIAQDQHPDNNTAKRYLAVSQDLYCLDAMAVIPAAQQSNTRAGTTTFAENTIDVRLLNYFEVHQEQAFTGVQVQLATQTQPGSYFIAAVYDTADVYIGTPLSSPLVESDVRIITQGDMNSGRKPSVAFLNPITLPVGAYYVSANMYQENGKNMFIMDDLTVPQPGGASMLWLPSDEPSNRHIYSNGNAWAVRLSSSPSVGVQELPNLEGVSIFPSPTNGPLEVRMDTPGKTTVEVFNALGKLVNTTRFNGTSTKVDLTGNSAGIYTVRVSDGARYNVQRIALN